MENIKSKWQKRKNTQNEILIVNSSGFKIKKLVEQKEYIYNEKNEHFMENSQH